MWEFIQHHWGDIASVAGLVAAIVAARQASNAKQAVAELRAVLLRMDTIAELAGVLEMYAEVKRLHRLADTPNVWMILPDRYAAIRTRLVLIRNANLDFTPRQQIDIQKIIRDLSMAERIVESFLRASKTSQSDASPSESVVKFSNEIPSHEDALYALLTEIKKKIGD